MHRAGVLRNAGVQNPPRAATHPCPHVPRPENTGHRSWGVRTWELTGLMPNSLRPKTVREPGRKRRGRTDFYDGIDMGEILKNILSGHNQFASGGLLLMIVGGLSVYLRAIPERLWEWLVSQTTMMITVNDDDASFFWVKEWLLEQDFLKRIRRVDLDTTIRNEGLALIPAPGTHWFWHTGRPFLGYFYRNEGPKGSSRRRTEPF